MYVSYSQQSYDIHVMILELAVTADSTRICVYRYID